MKMMQLENVVEWELFVYKVNYRLFELHVQQLRRINDFDHYE
jgi:hypothetical protein